MSPTSQPESRARRAAEPRSLLPPTERLLVAEIFHSIQGESTFAGLPCVLVRLTGCQMRCRWCDTEYAFKGGNWKTRDEIREDVAAFGCPLVELTGGEPLLQPGSIPLLRELCDDGYDVLLETGGGLDISDVDPRVRRILDVKCPGSGESHANHWENLEQLRPHDEIKCVLADRADYEWAREIVERHRLVQRCTVHFSPVHGSLDPADLAAWILADAQGVRLQLQVHKLLWGPDTQGV